MGYLKYENIHKENNLTLTENAKRTVFLSFCLFGKWKQTERVYKNRVNRKLFDFIPFSESHGEKTQI